MALSDVIKKIEDSPRSTKVAVFFAGTTVAAVAIAVFIAMQSGNTSEPEPAKAASLYAAPAQTMQVPSAPQLEPTPVPTKTPLPDPTKTPEPSPTPETTEKPTPIPTEIPAPIATPTPDANDYYVILRTGKILDNDEGYITFFAEYPFGVSGGGTHFNGEIFYLDYLKREGVITAEQERAYFNGESIEVPIVPIATASYKLEMTENRDGSKMSPLGRSKYLTHYADKSVLDSDQTASGIDSFLENKDEGHIMISDGKISVSAVDDDGNATTVQVEGIGAQELLEYWLSQNKITVQQVNQYGQTGEVQISLKDGVDLFNFAQSSEAGASFGIDKEAQDIIVNEILPLFKIGD